MIDTEQTLSSLVAAMEVAGLTVSPDAQRWIDQAAAIKACSYRRLDGRRGGYVYQPARIPRTLAPM